MTKKLSFLVLFFTALAVAQVPVCNITLSSTTATTSAWLNNQATLCRAWSVTYQASGFSALSFQVEGAPCSSTGCSTPGTAVAIGSPLQGSNPSTDTGQATIVTNLYYPWIRLNLASVTGTGTFSASAMGYPGLSAKASTIAQPGNVTSVFGRMGAVVAVSGDYTTTIVPEGTNLYFTDERARSAVSGATPITDSSGALALPNVSAKSSPVSAAASGNVDLYTCPSNRRALIPAIRLYNDSGSGVNVYGEVKISGNYFPLTNVASVSPNSSSTLVVGYILNAAESISINVGTASVISAYPGIIEFDATSPLSSQSLTSFGAGDNTLYTAPANHAALILSPANGGFSPFALLSVGGLNYVNRSGTTRTLKVNCVPSGGSPGTANQVATTASVTNTTATNPGACATLGPGDFLSVNVDAATATQFAWVNLIAY